MSDEPKKTMFKLLVKESRIEIYQFAMILAGLIIIIVTFGVGHWIAERMGR